VHQVAVAAQCICRMSRQFQRRQHLPQLAGKSIIGIHLATKEQC